MAIDNTESDKMLYVPALTSRHDIVAGFSRWEAGYKNEGRAFPLECAKEANAYARRVGPGAVIYEMPSRLKVAAIVKKSAHRPHGVVTEVTWEGGKYL